MRNIKVNSSKAFSLIEMIGVLAIIGILASVVAPKVFDAIRDAKITAAAAVNNAVKSATVDFSRKYRILPVDGSRGPAGDYTRTYGDGASVSNNNCTFGDILVSEGLLEKISVPIGPAGTNGLTTNSVVVGYSESITNVTCTMSQDYPAIVCFGWKATNESSKLFTAAANSIRVAALAIPQLTTLEAAGLKTKIDGPFDESVKSASEVVSAAVTRTATSPAIREAITRGNCLVFSNTSGTYDLLLYVAHD